MLSYTLSLIVVMVLLLWGISRVSRRYFPSTHKFSTGILRRAFKALIKRLGWYRSLLGMYLFFAVIVTIAMLSGFFRNFLKNVGTLTLIWLPPAGIWRVRKSLKERRERGYRLPGRRD